MTHGSHAPGRSRREFAAALDRADDEGASMSAPAKPRPVVACEQLWVNVAGRSYHWTNAIQGYRAGVWHNCCPGRCGGGITFTELADGSLDMRCHQGVCTEDELVRALTSGVRA